MKSYCVVSFTNFVTVTFSLTLLILFYWDASIVSLYCFINKPDNSTVNYLDYLNDFNFMKIETGVLLASSFLMFFFCVSCTERLNDHKLWSWLLLSFIGTANILLSLSVSVVMSIELTCFCGNIYSTTGIKNCMVSIETNENLYHLAIAVGISWWMFILFFFSLLISIFEILTRVYTTKIERLRQKVQDLDQCLRHQELLNNQRRSDYNFDPPEQTRYSSSNNYTNICNEQPLIQF